MDSSLHLTQSWSSVTVLNVRLNFICTCVIETETCHLRVNHSCEEIVPSSITLSDVSVRWVYGMVEEMLGVQWAGVVWSLSNLTVIYLSFISRLLKVKDYLSFVLMHELDSKLASFRLVCIRVLLDWHLALPAEFSFNHQGGQQLHRMVSWCLWLVRPSSWNLTVFH